MTEAIDPSKIRAIVTGASSGIGLATAEALAAAGVHVVATARRRDPLEQLAKEYRGQVSVLAADIAEPSTAVALRDLLAAGGEDETPVIVNAAGIASFGSFAETQFEDLQQQMKVNFEAPARLIHACLPLMLTRGKGQIVNVLSVTTQTPLAGCDGYAASKAALHSLGKTLLAGVRRQGIRLTSISPGAVDTPLWDGSEGGPNRSDMLPVSAVANVIRDIVLSQQDRNFDEVVILPPKGVL